MFENLFAFLGPLSSSFVLLSVVACAAIFPMMQTCPIVCPLLHGNNKE